MSTIAARIIATHTAAAVIVSDFMTAHTDNATGPASAVWSAMSLQHATAGSIAAHCSALVTNAIAAGDDAVSTAQQALAVLTAWRGVLVAETSDKAEIKKLYAACDYARRLIHKASGTVSTINKVDNSYTVTLASAKATPTKTATGSKAKGAAGNGVSVSPTGAGAVNNGDPVADTADALATVSTLDLLAALAKRFDNPAALVAEVEALSPALFKSAPVASSASAPAPRRSNSKTKASGEKRAKAAGVAVVPTLADALDAELVAELKKTLAA